jgi:CBS domain-containing protein
MLVFFGGWTFRYSRVAANAVSYAVSGKYSFYTLQPRTRVKAEKLALERFFLEAEKVVPEKLQKTLVSEVMTTKLIVLHQGSTVKDALDTFEGTNLRVLPVIDTFGHVVGVVNLEDMAYGDVKRYSLSLSETIIYNLVLISEQSSLEKVAQFMMEKEEDHIFVVDKEEKLIGVVSGIDIVKKIIELLSS